MNAYEKANEPQADVPALFVPGNAPGGEPGGGRVHADPDPFSQPSGCVQRRKTLAGRPLPRRAGRMGRSVPLLSLVTSIEFRFFVSEQRSNHDAIRMGGSPGHDVLCCLDGGRGRQAGGRGRQAEGRGTLAGQSSGRDRRHRPGKGPHVAEAGPQAGRGHRADPADDQRQQTDASPSIGRRRTRTPGPRC